MNIQAAPPTYTPMDGIRTPVGNPPVLGQQVPGLSGGLPSQGGLSVLANPMAQELQSQYAKGGAVQKAEQVRKLGRGEDTVLMHVTPHELKGLQALALAHGGSLTINPETGLPEAGFLGKVFKKLLPTLIGVGLNFIPGVGPLAAAGLTALGGTAVTGSLKKGLMAGLQAYGGASLATSLGAGVGKTAATAATTAAGTGAPGAVGQIGSLGGVTPQLAVPSAITNAAGNAALQGAPSLASAAQGFTPSIALNSGAAAAKTGLAALPGKFAAAARAGLPAGTPGIISKAAPMLAASGLMKGISGAMSPSGGGMTPTGQIDNSYQGPYYAQDRQQIMDLGDPTSSKQRRHFAIGMPEIRNTMGQVVQPGSMTPRGTQIMQPVVNPKAKKGQPMYDFVPVEYQGGVDPMQTGYAKGGEIELADGAFVVDARTVSEIGNGSSGAGQELLARMGGRPVRGPGDGVSDSIPARIGRDQPARVARDEVIFPPQAVRRVGKGSERKGAQKLYALMDKAHNARKKSERGKDTGLRRGLAL